jgi:hypothetical protein
VPALALPREAIAQRRAARQLKDRRTKPDAAMKEGLSRKQIVAVRRSPGHGDQPSHAVANEGRAAARRRGAWPGPSVSRRSAHARCASRSRSTRRMVTRLEWLL